jgi:hypothetical protein
MPSPTTTLSPSQLAQDLGVRDLTDPDQGRHAIQLLVDAASARLAAAWNCQVHRQRGPRVVPVEDNYDRLASRRTRSAATCATPAMSTVAACCAATPRR